MNYVVVAIRDRLTGFGSPILASSPEMGTRDFLDACENLPPRRKADLSFYQLGTFDTDSGLILPNGVPVYICSADSNMHELPFGDDADENK
nr:DNA binding protein [Microvirus sp.]